MELSPFKSKLSMKIENSHRIYHAIKVDFEGNTLMFKRVIENEVDMQILKFDCSLLSESDIDEIKSKNEFKVVIDKNNQIIDIQS